MDREVLGHQLFVTPFRQSPRVMLPSGVQGTGHTCRCKLCVTLEQIVQDTALKHGCTMHTMQAVHQHQPEIRANLSLTAYSFLVFWSSGDLIMYSSRSLATPVPRGLAPRKHWPQEYELCL